VRISSQGTIWTLFYGGGALTIDLHVGASLDLIVFAPDTPELIAERLHRVGYPDAASAPNFASFSDDGNPYRSPVVDYS
jgi:hypothetical protein